MQAAANHRSVQRMHVSGKTLRVHALAHFPRHFFDNRFVCITAFCLVNFLRNGRVPTFSDDVDCINKSSVTCFFQHNAPHHENSQTLVVTQMHCSSVFASDEPHVGTAFNQLLCSFQIATGSRSVQRRPQARIQLGTKSEKK